MRLIDRLYQYLEHKNISNFTFEKTCGISNGYLYKQFRGKGTIGSDILEKIYHNYLDLSLIWLITGEGEMLVPQEEKKEKADYTTSREEVIQLLKEQVHILERSNADKDKIIRLLEVR